MFAETLLEVDFVKKIIINIDETWLGMSDFRRFKWCKLGENNAVATK